MFRYTGNSFTRTRIHYVALLAIWLICGNCLTAVAFQGLPPTPTYPPMAMDDLYQTSYNTSIYFDPLENDYGISAPIDPSTLTIELEPAHGTVEIDGGTGFVEYTPDEGYAGIDQFIYTVKDINGNTSNFAMVNISVINLPPILVSFNVSPGPQNTWIFEGQVVDEDPATCTITFGGLLEGFSTTPNADGTFRFGKIFGPDDDGTVSAEAEDELGLTSGEMYAEVYHY